MSCTNMDRKAFQRGRSLFFEGNIKSHIALCKYTWGQGLACPILTGKYVGDGIKLWDRFAAGGTGTLHRIDAITRKENLSRNIKATSQDRKLELGPILAFQMDNNSNLTAKLVIKPLNNYLFYLVYVNFWCQLYV